MTKYTPTTEWIRIIVGHAKTTAVDRTLPGEAARAEGYEWFDRWLAAHDADVRKAALAEAAQIAEEEGLFDGTGDPADEAYDSAIQHAAAAIRAAALGDAPTTKEETR